MESEVENKTKCCSNCLYWVVNLFDEKGKFDSDKGRCLLKDSIPVVAPDSSCEHFLKRWFKAIQFL